ncbi:phage portal protein [Sphingorhabdus soli]|uniref:Phage portal protein n=1 Tax=Flavisphingopyxis soli TaxID=2601267 RepID=A0A5C6U6T6_9SPHN|nr:phage portal protein [Sphingorhabdus soli]TXC68180.1 phage portal protein [Sphingorhabdus soli]
MKLFGWKAAREAARPVLARAGYAGGISRIGLGVIGGAQAQGAFPQGYEAQLREGYLANAVAQRAVRVVADAVAGVPVTVVGAHTAPSPTSPRPGGQGFVSSPPEEGEENAARLLGLVRASSGGQSLLETLAVHLLLHGNGYVQLLDDGAGGVSELYALRPDRVSVEADARGWPVAYLYRVGQSVTRLEAEGGPGHPRIVHIRLTHPIDDHYGLGCLGAASGAIAIHNAAAHWNKALLDNAARPSGALVFDAGDGSALSADQFARLKAEMEAGFAGAGNAGRPMLLEGGLKWQAMSLTPADMDFIELKHQAAREIALAFGVPPMLIGLPGDATYANYREASKALWRQTVLPLAGKILGALGQALGGELVVDLDKVPALSEDRERLWGQVAGAEFLTRAEKRAMLGLG